ncbi:MAG TPA: ATP-binding protein [Actinomycetota bacterium]
MGELTQTLKVLQSVMFGGLALVTLVLWRRHGGTAAARLAATFGLLAAATTIGGLLPVEPGDKLVDLVRKLLAALVILFPWLLWWFTTSFVPASRPLFLVATCLTGLLAVGALLLPSIPHPGEPVSPLIKAYIGLVLVQWLGLSGAVAAILWHAGQGQPTVVRRRMRTLALGTLALAAAVATAGVSVGAERGSTTQAVVQVLSLLSPPLFLIGFAPPAVVRTIWQRPEETALRLAEIRCVGARDPASLAGILLPPAASLAGGGCAVLADGHGKVLGAHGLNPGEAEAMVAGIPESGDGPYVTEGGGTILAVPLRSASLLVQSTPFSPLFGRDEINRLVRLGVLVDLALERMRTDEQIRSLNEELAGRVHELEAANRELEAFSYSVSHDLRAPLRAIDGFTNILIEEHAGALSADCRRYLDTIRCNTRQMGQLIDDLLALARTGRQALRRRHVEPAELARQALADLEHERRGRLMEITIGDLPACEADPALLKQVFVNLIANALKFTRGREPALVEVGCTRESTPARNVYFVRDNGVGFDMRYAGKLFGVFQRLHRQEEFEGTGVGLAIVQRIIRRHGGDIWAHAEVGAGARFEFFIQ